MNVIILKYRESVFFFKRILMGYSTGKVNWDWERTKQYGLRENGNFRTLAFSKAEITQKNLNISNEMNTLKKEIYKFSADQI